MIEIFTEKDAQPLSHFGSQIIIIAVIIMIEELQANITSLRQFIFKVEIAYPMNGVLRAIQKRIVPITKISIDNQTIIQ